MLHRARTTSARAAGDIPDRRVVLVAAWCDGETTIAGVAADREQAIAWLRSPAGTRFRHHYGDLDALHAPLDTFMQPLVVGELGNDLDSDLPGR